jgi:hypothetical protein
MFTDVTEDLEETDDEARLPEPMATDDDDEQALFDEMIDVMVTPEEAAIEASEASPRDIALRSSRDDEFTCRSCHLIMSRSCLVDAERSICRDCRQASAVGPGRSKVP